jgi:hypothetical protein
MAVADRVREVLAGAPPVTEVPKEIEERTGRGRSRMKDGASKRNEAMKFWRGDQYVYRSDDGMLISQNTITLSNGTGKPRHRVRTTRNMLLDIVAHEVSAATQRVPGYEINPSSSDPEDIAAARMGDKVARFGYDKWRLRQVTESVVTYAVVAEAGFAWPYWDSSVGPYMEQTDPRTGEARVIGEGEVGVRIFGPNEVYWEPGLKFDESRWHVVEQAMPLADIYAMEGFNKSVKLTANATADEDGVTREKVSQHAKLCLVKFYLERPCPKYPNGRWLTIANGKQVVPEKRYPCEDAKGNVVDEPALHHLCYILDPDSDRDQALVPHLIDAQRTVNDCQNKVLEWKNLALNPQVIIRNGEFKQQLTDEPGAVYHAVGSGEITWRPVPPIPNELLQIKQEAINDMARISAQNDIPGQVESGRGIQALIEKDQSRRGAFIANLAEFHSRLMRHCLWLVQRHYTEPRLLTVQGKRGRKLIHDFKGAQLRGQADVTVLPGSIEPRTRTQITQLVLAYADRGWIDPDSAMTAIDNGTAEALMERIELDEGRTNEIIQSIEDDTFMDQAPRPVFPDEDAGFEVEPVYATDDTGQQILDPMGQPIVLQPGIPATTVPGWMPRPFDRVEVHEQIITDWMKSQAWSLLTDDQKQAGMAYYSALLQIKAQQAAKAQAQQMQQAMELGTANAARPTDKGMPDQPGGSGQNGQQPSNGQVGAPQPF